MSMSLDGYVTGPDVSPEAPMGSGGEALHEWMFEGRSAAEIQDYENRNSAFISCPLSWVLGPASSTKRHR
ncbi:MAG: hypothetical protein ACRDKF_01480 [Actinomycetota bacterium]